MPFDLVIDRETSWGEEVHTSRSSVCGEWGAIAGDLRYFSDRSGRARGAIEGTQLPYELIWEFADAGEPEIVYDPGHRRQPLRLRRARRYHGFELDREESGIDTFPAGLEEATRRALAEAVAGGAAGHPDARANRETVRALRDVYRRSGGTTRELSDVALADFFTERLVGVGSHAEFREADLRIDPDDWVPAAERARWEQLPDTVELAGSEYPLDYALEDGTAVARVRVPAKLLPALRENELPELDRPLRWTVIRGKREAIRAASLEEARRLVKAAHSEREPGAEEESGERPRRKAQRERGGQGKGAPAPRNGRRGRGRRR